jgi:hypothetical protein
VLFLDEFENIGGNQNGNDETNKYNTNELIQRMEEIKTYDNIIISSYKQTLEFRFSNILKIWS